MSGYRYKGKEITCEPLIDPKFSPAVEAQPFVRFWLLKKLTFAQCRAAILMMPEQFHWLVETKCVDRPTLMILYKRRIAVWEAFLEQMREFLKQAA